MSRASGQYKPIVGGATVNDAYNLASRALTRANQALAVAIVALFIGFGLSLGFGVANRQLANQAHANTLHLEGQVTTLQTQMSLAQNQVLQILMGSGSPNITVIQNGTFTWELQENNLPTASTYKLESVVASGIELTVLVIDPPNDVVTFTANVDNYYPFRMHSFTPPIEQLPGLHQFNSAGFGYIIPLTYGNVNRIKSIIPGCVTTDPDCIFEGQLFEGGPITRNSLIVESTFTPSTAELRGIIFGANAAGLEFGLTASWEIVLPTG